MQGHAGAKGETLAKDREQELVRLLKTSPTPLTARALSELIGVSIRTVKNYVKRVNESGMARIESGQSGYRIDVSEVAPSPSEKSKAPAASMPVKMANDIPQNNLERSAYVMKRLFQGPGELNIFDLCEELYISISTMKTVLSILRRKLGHFGLQLVQSENRISIEGPEKSKRRLLSDLLHQESTSTFLDLKTIHQAFPDLDPTYISTVVRDVLSQHHCFVNDYSLVNIVLHTAISIDRFRAKHSVDAVPTSEHSGNGATGDTEHAIAAEIAQKLQERFEISFPASEIDELALLLSTRVSRLDYRQASKESIEHFVDPECLELVEGVIEDLKEYFGIDLTDPDFYVRFALHLKNLLARARNGENARNPLTQRIRSSCPLLYDTAVAEAAVIAQKTGLTISEDEIGYIAFHLGSTIETQKQLTDKVRAALYCPSYYQIDKQIMLFLNRYFENDILVTDVVTTEDELDYVQNIELLISTVPVNRYAKTPVLMISPFPSAADRKEIGAVTDRIRAERNRAKIAANLREFIKPDLFVTDASIKTRDEAVHRLASLLEERGFVSASFEEEILHREELSSTAFAHFAIPHTVRLSAKRSAIAVLSTSGNIDWGDQGVSLVFMLAFNKNDSDSFYEVFDPLVNMLSNPEKISRLVGITDYDAFIDRICTLTD